MTKSQFKEILKARILPNLNTKTIVQIETVDSEHNVNIQIADWISGALARYLERGKMGDEFFQSLKGNIIGEGKELFNSLIIYD